LRSLKSFVIWHCENPRTCKQINMYILQVYYGSNQKSWRTKLLSQDAHQQNEESCLENKIHFKVLPIANNSQHIFFYIYNHPNIKVMFFLLQTNLVDPINGAKRYGSF
jgi:hypothetical protein